MIPLAQKMQAAHRNAANSALFRHMARRKSRQNGGMASILRTALTVAMFVSSWSLMIGVFLFAADWFAGLAAAWMAPLWRQAVGFVDVRFPEAAHVMAAVPSWLPDIQLADWTHAVAVISVKAAAVAAGAIAAWQLAAPIEWDVKRAVRGLQYSRVPSGTKLCETTARLARKAGLRPPKVYLAHSQAFNAIAISKPFRSAVIVFQGMFVLPPECLEWVLAHELGHIRRNDSFPGILRDAVVGAINAMARARVSLLRLLWPGIVRLPLLRLLVLPLEVVLVPMLYVTAMATRLSFSVLSVLDKVLLRHIEYRADDYACSLVGARPGMTVMSILGEVEDSGFSLLSDHPPARLRLRRIARRSRSENRKV